MRIRRIPAASWSDGPCPRLSEKSRLPVSGRETTRADAGEGQPNDQPTSQVPAHPVKVTTCAGRVRRRRRAHPVVHRVGEAEIDSSFSEANRDWLSPRVDSDPGLVAVDQHRACGEDSHYGDRDP